MKYRTIVLAMMAFALGSCVGEKVENRADEDECITVRAFQEGASETRTTLIDGGNQIWWEPADEIKLFFRGSGSRFISQNTENARVAEFTGTLSVAVGLNEGATGSNTLWGLYPYRADATSDGETVTTTLPSQQTGRAGSFAKGTFITLAQSNSFDLAFYNVCGGLRFSLTQEGIQRVTLEGNNGETLAGRIKLAFTDGVPAVKEITEGETILELTAPGGGTFQTGQWYYIEVLPGTLSNGYKMVFYKDSESAKLTSSSTVAFRRGVFGSLADADEDLVFKPLGSSEPDPNDVIQFKDPIAKYACVEKFDTNGDGEVSFAEAAAATTLSGLFTDWNTVTEFDEIRYFTSVTSTQNVFNGLAQLKHITIPDNITTLGTFQNCTALDTVKLPAALASLPSYCFDGCSSLKSVTLPTGITTILDYTFHGCSSLTNLNVPSTIMSVGQYAFSQCTALTGIDLPSGLKTIGKGAFASCKAIASVDFPASLTSIGSGAYSGCTALLSATIGNGVSVGEGAFSACFSLASVVLPEDMSTIPSRCFADCPKLATIIWPTTLTTIENEAFTGCRFEDNGYALQLPSSVTTIGSHAFGGLRHLVLPSKSVILIASNSFETSYTILYVPANMVEMYKVRSNWSNYSDRIRPITDYPLSSIPTPEGSIGEPVDLGLSVEWASWNVGASTPEEYGAYFAWGETEPYLWDYDWANYKWCSEEDYTWGNIKLTKYCPIYKTDYWDGAGTPDNKTILDMEDDAARANWGGTWRMPTDAEWAELGTSCTWTWTTQNGVNGRLVTASNGNSIFLPAAGQKDGFYLRNAGSDGNYWSSSLYKDVPELARGVRVKDGQVLYNRHAGLSVRPVCP